MDLKNISDGFLNLAKKKLGILPANIAELATERYAKCLQCTQHHIKTDRCKLCGCYLPAKVLSLDSKCPDKKW